VNAEGAGQVEREVGFAAETPVRCVYGTCPTSSLGLGLFCPRPSFEETRDINIGRSGLQCGDAVLARGELSRRGGQDRRSAQWVCWNPFGPLLGRSSEAFIGLCDLAQDVFGYTFIHLLGTSEHLFGATVPMRRIIVGHD
jgi:hypothetical protein